MISAAFGNRWEMFQKVISVAFTNAGSHEATYVRYSLKFPMQYISWIYRWDYGQAEQEPLWKQARPKGCQWYHCLYSFLVEIGFKSVES